MNTTQEEKRREIEELLDKNIEELFVLLAHKDPAYVGEFFTPREAKERGEESYNRLSDPLYQKICIEWKYCKRRHEPDFKDTMALIIALCDLILSVVGGIPVTLIAVLLFKKNLNSFCNCVE